MHVSEKYNYIYNYSIALFFLAFFFLMIYICIIDIVFMAGYISKIFFGL